MMTMMLNLCVCVFSGSMLCDFEANFKEFAQTDQQVAGRTSLAGACLDF
jgi:hypothetical protein